MEILKRKLSSFQIILLGFAGVILLGALILTLPIFSSLLYAIRQYHAQSNDYLDLKQ